MVLDVPKLIYNVVAKQAKISHQDDCQFLVFKKDEIPADIKKKIDDQYAEEFLEDASVVLFARGPIDKKKVEKLFNCVDKALGSDANKLVEGDFKLLKMKKDEEDLALTADDSSDETPDKEISDIIDGPESEEDAEVDPVDASNEDSIDDAINSELSSEDDSLEDSDTQEGSRAVSSEETDVDDSSEDDDSEEEEEEDVDESLNEDDENVEAAVDKPALPTKYVFLKITLKD